MNGTIVKIFRELALFYEMKDDKFRARAYERGAEVLDTETQDVKDIYEEKGLKGLDELAGIGWGMAEKIEEYIKTKHIKEFDLLKKKIPIDIRGLTSVEGLGPKSAGVLFKKLGVKNLKDLEDAARAGKIRKLKGFGEKTERNILEGIEFVKRNTGRMTLGQALPKVRYVMERLGKLKEVSNISEAGSLRRRKETIGDLDILASSDKPKRIIDYFIAMPDVIKVWGSGPTKASVRVRGNFDIDLRVIPEQSWGAALQYFTGSKAHNIKLRQIAIDKGLKLNEYGLFRGEKSIAGKTEKEIYEALGFKYLDPELREDTGEIEAMPCGIYDIPHKNVGYRKSHIGCLPKVIEYGSLRGDLQVQTNWTDGAHSIEEMAREAKRLGLAYIAITDHTKNLAMTGGLDEKKLLSQMREIDRINSEFQDSGFKLQVLKGAEVDILKDGSLDIKDEVLAKLDVVGASVHSLFKMSEPDMTERVLSAMSNPNVDILFHPTGRIIQKREAYKIDMARVIKEAVKTGTILEINAFPDRLDLKDEHIRMAVEAGAKFVIDSDAHNYEHFKYLEFGIAQARRGWATSSDVINTLPLSQFLRKLKH